MPYPMEHAARIADPEKFEKDSFSRKEIAPGIDAIFGKRPGSKTVEIQSYRFNAEAFTADKAQAWLKERKIEAADFEPAMQDEEPAPVEATRAEDGTYTLSNVQILATGKFNASKGGQVEFTEADLAAIEADTNAHIGLLKPPVKLGHGEQTFPQGGAPAFGWLTGVKRVGRKMIATLSHVPEALVEAIRLGRYRTRSAEVIQNWTHPETGERCGMVVKALAFLGAEMPAIQTLDDLVKLEADSASAIEFAIDTTEGSDVPGVPADDEATNEQPSDGGAVATEMIATCPKCGQSLRISSSGELTVETEAEGGEELPEEPEVPEGEEDMSDEKEKALTAERDALKAKLIEVQLAALVNDRRILPAQVQSLTETLLCLSFDMADKQLKTLAQGPQMPDITQPVADVTDPAKSVPSTKTGGERIVELAAQLVSDGKAKDIEQATILAYQMEPEAARAYDAKTTMRRNGKEA